MKKLIQNFFLCGLIGWCTEIVFTALQSLRRRDLCLTGQTSLWMFPIYGLGCFLIFPYKVFKNCSAFIRALVYMVCIFTGEFVSGTYLRKHNFCPWDYTRCRLHVKKVIRLDYAPLWGLFGLLLEFIHNRNP